MLRFTEEEYKNFVGERAKPRRSKYHAEKTDVDGIIFDSKKEAMRYAELRLLERSGEISKLMLQPKFEIIPAFTDQEGKRHRATYYIADFSYEREGKSYVEDTKGVKTAVYRLKEKLFLQKYGEGITFVVR